MICKSFVGMPSRDQSDYVRRQKYRAIVISGGQGDIRNRYTDQSSLVAMANTAGKAFTAPTTRVPDAPLSLSGDISDSLVVIYVTDGGDGGSPLLGYAYSIDNSAGPYTDIPYNSPFEIDGLTNGQNYTFYIKAKNASGYSVLPASITLSPATVPDAPTLSTPVPGNGTLTVPFTAPTNTGGRPLTGYKYSVNSSSYIVLDPSSSPLVLTSLTNGTSYTVRMKATNSRGDSVESNAVFDTPFGLPFAPDITSIAPGNNSLTIAFTAGLTNGSAITNYEYSTDDGANFKALSPADAISPITINTLSSSVTPPLQSLINGTTYQVKIRAVNAAGAGIFSDRVEGTPSATAIPPELLRFDPSIVESYSGSGDIVTSIGTSTISGTKTPSVSYSSIPQIGGVFYFNGGGSTITFPNFNFGQTFTVISWINSESKLSINALLANETSGNNSVLDGFKLGWNSWNSENNYLIFEGKASALSSGVDSITYGTWQMVSYSLNTLTNTLTFYNNAAQQGSPATLPAGLNTNTTKGFRIGSFTDSSFTMKAYLGELRVYPAELTQVQIQSIYDITKSRYGF
jgi:hypothetical protein